MSSDKASSPMLETSKGLQNHTPSTSRLLLYSRSLRILLTLRKHASAFFTYPKKHRHPSNSTKPIPFFCPWKMHWHKLQHVSCSTRVPSARNASARAAKTALEHPRRPFRGTSRRVCWGKAHLASRKMGHGMWEHVSLPRCSMVLEYLPTKLDHVYSPTFGWFLG